MLRIKLAGEHFSVLLKKPFAQSVQAPETMFVVCVEVLLFYHYTLVSISPPGFLLFCITLNA